MSFFCNMKFHITKAAFIERAIIISNCEFGVSGVFMRILQLLYCDIIVCFAIILLIYCYFFLAIILVELKPLKIRLECDIIHQNVGQRGVNQIHKFRVHENVSIYSETLSLHNPLISWSGSIHAKDMAWCVTCTTIYAEDCGTENLVPVYKTTRRHTPQDRNLEVHRYENLECQLYYRILYPYWLASIIMQSNQGHSEYSLCSQPMHSLYTITLASVTLWQGCK
jgi:hypothetical protein